MSFNILHDNNWETRRELVVDAVAGADPDVVGLQEALVWQLEYLVAELPDDGRRGGESVGMLYRKDRFDLVDSGHFWFSDRPAIPGSMPGADWGSPTFPRMATWLRLRDRITAREWYFFNAHLQHDAGADPRLARLNSVELLLQRIAALDERVPVVVTGDFNATDAEPSIRRMTGGARPFVDAYHAAGDSRQGGTRCFDSDDTGRRIDYVFVSQGVAVLDYRVGEKQAGICASDHRTVFAVLSPD